MNDDNVKLKPIMSVIVPVYNVEKYLSQCIDSILEQIFTDFELILIDDGSSDNSPQICDEYAMKDARIRVIHKENSGVSSARNAGISIATGKYITFIDSDDTVDNMFFAKAVSDIQRSNADLYICGLTMETWNNDKVVSKTDYNIEKTVCYSVRNMFENLEVSYPLICVCSPCCKLYSKNIIEKAKLRFDESISLGEDIYFNMHYFELCESVFFAEDIFYHYRRGNDNSLFSKLHKDTYEIHVKVYGKMQDVMKNKDCNKSAILRLQTMYAQMFIGCIHAFFSKKNSSSNAEKREIIKKVSNNLLIQNIDYKDLDKKTKAIVFLMRKKALTIIYLIFKLWYGMHF